MAYQGGKLSDGTPLNVAVYKAYRNAGLSHSQSMAITAEVGRENGFNANVLFGGHIDPAANSGGGSIQNLGMLSWNQDRGRNLAKFLHQKGVMSNGGMAKNQANLNAQAQFSVGEMKSKRYAGGLKNFWSNPNANPEAYSKELGKNYIAWAYGQNTIKAQGGGRKPFNWQSHNNRRQGYLGTLGNMLGDKNNYPQGQPQAPDPRLSMSAPKLLAYLRKDKNKRSELQMLYELSNNNGLAGREIKQLMAQGAPLNDIASQLGIKVPEPQVEQPQVSVDMPDIGAGYEDFMSNLTTNEVEPPQVDMPDIGENYDDFITNLTLDEPQPTQTGDAWQIQKTSSDSTSNEKSAREPQTLESSWESLS